VLNECCGRHDLAGLAVTALDNLQAQPSLLNSFAAWGLADCFDRCDSLVSDTGDRRDAGPYRTTIDMHCAGPAQSSAAAKFRPRQSYDIAQNPQQWHVIRNIEVVLLAIDAEARHRGLLLKLQLHGQLDCALQEALIQFDTKSLSRSTLASVAVLSLMPNSNSQTKNS
jgi:hypothetical protein